MNLPNALTLSRIFVVPFLVVVLLTPFSENWLGVPRHILGVTLFLAAALTDYLDGRIARSRHQVSQLGKLLDPIADKLLISAALISLVENRLAPAWAVVIIIGREFAVSGLRSIAAEGGVVIAASRMGKFKMMSQVVAVALLIVSSASGSPPVANFGRAFPAIQFWTVPELRAAIRHLVGQGATTVTTGRCCSTVGARHAVGRGALGNPVDVRLFPRLLPVSGGTTCVKARSRTRRRAGRRQPGCDASNERAEARWVISI